MHRKKSQTKGIFCLEGDWDLNLKNKDRVKPILDLLSQNDNPHIYRTIGTKHELFFYLEKWRQKRYDDYPILYLAFHGEPNCIFTSEKGKNGCVTLEELAESLQGCCTNRYIHFGSCSTIKIDKRKIKTFLKKTNALAVTGFRTDVDWTESACFETLLLLLLASQTSCDIIRRIDAFMVFPLIQ